MSDVCRALGLVPRGANYATVWDRIGDLGIDAQHLHWRMTKEPLAHLLHLVLHPRRVAEAVQNAESVAGTCRNLGLDPIHHRRRVEGAIGRLGLDTSHFTGQRWAKGKTVRRREPRPLEEILQVGPRLASSSDLRRRLLAEGLRQHRCEGCELSEWAGRPIPLELDHVNGDRHDNRLENLRVLCPNCHALTPTYRGRNIGRRGVTAGAPGLNPGS